jgi:large subunit ribosomal protein L21
VYAIVRSGGRQEKVSVGDTIVMDRQDAKPGSKINLPALMVVDNGKITHDAQTLSATKVEAEVISHDRGPKIKIQHYRSKTGYKRRLGHRQELTTVKVTDIKVGK